MANDKIVSLTIRLPEESAEKFRNNAIKQDKNQSEYLISLIESDSKQYHFPIQNSESANTISCLLRNCNTYNDTALESKVFRFDGKIIFISGQRDVPFFSRNQVKNELSLPDYYDINYNQFSSEENKKEEIIKTFYQFGLYQRFSDNKFIIYETFSSFENNLNTVYKSRCKILKNKNDVLSNLKPYTFPDEILSVEYLLADSIENDSDLDFYL